MHPTHTPTTDVELTPADLLRCAARYLLRHGWHQGDMYARTVTNDPATPPACALGAIRMAVCGGPDTAYDGDQAEQMNTAVHAFAGLLIDWTEPDPDEIRTDDPYDVVADWNDDAHTRADHVIAALHDAANRWEQRHPNGGDPR
jgi:membrane-bound lytic murein transglycosylase B